MTVENVVIAGAGQAGLEAAVALRREGFEGPVTLIGDEVHLPYQRPPLSKAFLKGGEPASVILRPAAFFEREKISVRTGVRITGIDRNRKLVSLGDKETVGYDHLLLALGGTNRTLPIAGADLANILSLRSLDEATRLRGALPQAKKIAVIGGGFIGLEIAATARGLGAEVTVLESASRLMIRSVLEPTSEAVRAAHEASGIDIRLGARVVAILDDGSGAASGVQLDNGETIDADLVLLAVGLKPNTELAEEAGLDVDDGVLVDRHLLTSDPSISAIGDCARFPGPHGAHIRLESVQNAVGQGKRFAANIVHGHAPYEDLPWFWSDQGALRLQMVGLTAGADTAITTTPSAGTLVVQAFKNGVLTGVEAMNAPAQFVRARRVLSEPGQISVEKARSLGWSLDRYVELVGRAP